MKLVFWSVDELIDSAILIVIQNGRYQRKQKQKARAEEEQGD
jgi:hypothetical protein